jgi:hypothetical protein
MAKRLEDESVVMDFITDRLGDDAIRSVENELTAKEMMAKLTQLHSRTGPSVRSCLRNQLSNLKFDGKFSDLKAIFSEHEKILREMDAANCNMSYVDKVHSLLESIPRKFEMLVSQFQSREVCE